jgi:hypothetical protein
MILIRSGNRVSPSRRWNPAWSRITTWTASGSVFNLSGIQFVWEMVFNLSGK